MKEMNCVLWMRRRKKEKAERNEEGEGKKIVVGEQAAVESFSRKENKREKREGKKI